MISNVAIFLLAIFGLNIIGCLCDVAVLELPRENQAIDESTSKALPEVEPSAELATIPEKLNSKMVTLKDLNEKIMQKIIDELERIKLTNSVLNGFWKKIDYLNYTVEEGNPLNAVVKYVTFVRAIDHKIIYEAEVFDRFNYDSFSTRIQKQDLSQDHIINLIRLVDISIHNAMKNQALIEESLEDDDLEQMVQQVEVKREQLENQMKEVTEAITQLELKPRDEEAINKIKSTNIVEMGKIGGEIHETVRSELNMSNAFHTIYDAIVEMVDTQKSLLTSIILA